MYYYFDFSSNKYFRCNENLSMFVNVTATKLNLTMFVTKQVLRLISVQGQIFIFGVLGYFVLGPLLERSDGRRHFFIRPFRSCSKIFESVSEFFSNLRFRLLFRLRLSSM